MLARKNIAAKLANNKQTLFCKTNVQYFFLRNSIIPTQLRKEVLNLEIGSRIEVYDFVSEMLPRDKEEEEEEEEEEEGESTQKEGGGYLPLSCVRYGRRRGEGGGGIASKEPQLRRSEQSLSRKEEGEGERKRKEEGPEGWRHRPILAEHPG